MPHQCVHCGKVYPTASNELLSGCSCGSHFFYFVRQENLEELKKETAPLTEEDKKEIEQDVRDIIGVDADEVKPVILDFESIRIREPGKFEIDLVKLFRKKPLIYKVEEGKYIIDLASTFKISREEKERGKDKSKK